MRESVIQGKVTSYLKKLGHPYIKTSGAGSRGWPDITACINGRLVSIEMKAPGNVPTAKQQAVADKIRYASGLWVSYDNERDCYEMIDYVENLEPIEAIDYRKLPKSLIGKEVTHVSL